MAQSGGGNDPQSALKSAVQRELDALYEKQGKSAPNMMPGGKQTEAAAPSNRQTQQAAPAARSATQAAPAARQASPAARKAAPVAHQAAPQSAPATRQAARPAAPATSSGRKSEIQRELEALYAKDGREMPTMDISQMPQAAEEADGYDVPSRQAYHDEPAEKPSLLQRLNPFRKRDESTANRSEGSGLRMGRPPASPAPRRSAQDRDVDGHDEGVAESSGKPRFLPRFLRRDDHEAEEAPAPRPQESIAHQPRRTATIERSVPVERSAPIERSAPAEETATHVPPMPELDLKPADEFHATPEESPSRSLADDGDDDDAPSIAEKAVREHAAQAAREALKLKRAEEFIDDEDDAELARKTPAKKSAARNPLEIEKAAPSPTGEKHEAEQELSQTPYVDDFPNPFTEITESEADKKLADLRAKAAAKHEAELREASQADDENPFTGLTLEDEKPALKANEPAGPVEEPKVAETKATELKGAVTKTDDAPELEIKKVDAPELKLEPAATTAPPKLTVKEALQGPKIVDRNAPNPLRPERAVEMPSEDDPIQRAKMRRLSTRRGLTGLKGFCPVALRDTRDLIDTKQEFTSVYNGKTYEFSSAQAKQAFDAEPEKYVPVMGGADVIVDANSHQTIEGSLDHAVWFRDRLYLFSSAESLEAFVLNPVEYAHHAE